MPNYKICRFCPEKYVPIADEKICPKCKEAVIKAVRYEAFGEPIVGGTIPDPVIEAMKQAVADANPEVIETPPEVPEPVIPIKAPEVPSAPILPPEPELPQVEKDIVAIKEAVVELDKIEDAIIVKEELIAPAAPKPEEKPDAQN